MLLFPLLLSHKIDCEVKPIFPLTSLKKMELATGKNYSREEKVLVNRCPPFDVEGNDPGQCCSPFRNGFEALRDVDGALPPQGLPVLCPGALDTYISSAFYLLLCLPASLLQSRTWTHLSWILKHLGHMPQYKFWLFSPQNYLSH